jgi:hypothetical protein
MRHPLAAVTAASVILLAGAAADASSSYAQSGPVNCKSGQTLFRSGATRAFLVTKKYARDVSYEVVFACTSGRRGRHVRVLYYGDIGTSVSADMFRLTGEHLGFHIPVEGGTSFEDYLGWIDTKTGVVRRAKITSGPGGEDPSEPAMPRETIDYAIAEDGAIAVIGSEYPAQEVCLLVPGRRSFKPLKTLVFAENGGLNKHFIEVSATTVTWKTEKGVPVTVSR